MVLVAEAVLAQLELMEQILLLVMVALVLPQASQVLA
jgi:hypothetical protein